jgi:hypothetical protein
MAIEVKHDEIANLRQEIKDLEAAIGRRDAPLSPYTMGIARAKIAKLQGQIKELEEVLAHAGQLADVG